MMELVWDLAVKAEKEMVEVAEVLGAAESQHELALRVDRRVYQVER